MVQQVIGVLLHYGYAHWFQIFSTANLVNLVDEGLVLLLF